MVALFHLHPPASLPGLPPVALMGDIIGSKPQPNPARATERFATAADQANMAFQPVIASPLTIKLLALLGGT